MALAPNICTTNSSWQLRNLTVKELDLLFPAIKDFLVHFEEFFLWLKSSAEVSPAAAMEAHRWLARITQQHSASIEALIACAFDQPRSSFLELDPAVRSVLIQKFFNTHTEKLGQYATYALHSQPGL